MADHTPELQYQEPWTLGPESIFTGNTCIQNARGIGIGSFGAPRAGRIVACVNACAGLTDDELKTVIGLGGVDSMLRHDGQQLSDQDHTIARQAASIERLRALLAEFEDRGTARDLNPTNYHLWTDADWLAYLRAADNYVREKARAALAETEATS